MITLFTRSFWTQKPVENKWHLLFSTVTIILGLYSSLCWLWLTLRSQWDWKAQLFNETFGGHHYYVFCLGLLMPGWSLDTSTTNYTHHSGQMIFVCLYIIQTGRMRITTKPLRWWTKETKQAADLVASCLLFTTQDIAEALMAVQLAWSLAETRNLNASAHNSYAPGSYLESLDILNILGRCWKWLSSFLLVICWMISIKLSTTATWESTEVTFLWLKITINGAICL